MFQSPTDPLVHPEHGLWHAYHGALMFSDKIALPPKRRPANPCRACLNRLCLIACPVKAFSDESYDVQVCFSYLSSGAGGGCLDYGCGARRVCPIGTEYDH
jgi:epoxyqueuosine reductase QueG